MKTQARPLYTLHMSEQKKLFSSQMEPVQAKEAFSPHLQAASPYPILHRDALDPRALQIVKTLQGAGHETYLVGGCVRDLLLNLHPKDFDIATSARPAQVKRLIPYSFIIGRRFRLVLVKRGSDQFEVSTFRRDPLNERERNFGENLYGTAMEDAKRRDFTINSLFYDPIQDDLIDYNQGLKDIQNRMLRMIGEPLIRLEEDPIRLLRALRFSHKLGFTLAYDLRTAMMEKAHELCLSAAPRRREELLKILRLPHPRFALLEAYDLGLLEACWPQLHETFSAPHELAEGLLFLNAFKEKLFDIQNPAQVFVFFLYTYLAYFQKEEKIEKLLAKRPTFPKETVALSHELGLFSSEYDMAKHTWKWLRKLMLFSSAPHSPSNLTSEQHKSYLMALSLAKADYFFLSSKEERITKNKM